MVGIELIALAAPTFLGFQSSVARIDPRAVFVGALSLGDDRPFDLEHGKTQALSGTARIDVRLCRRLRNWPIERIRILENLGRVTR